ncbi:hypothetical protein HHI36_023930 [Cryptolaemus montrouzieri]|uniref:Uncharacterized protein n=1 Tax=Cryptolaemus montrouzieri TaxID=559131 RepID=A0ABD2NPA6_9CUCU
MLPRNTKKGISKSRISDCYRFNLNEFSDLICEKNMDVYSSMLTSTFTTTSTSSSSRYAHSDKIKERRRTLFPSETISNSVDNLDLDCMGPLSSSDTEFDSSNFIIDKDNANFILSTQFKADVLCTPKNKNYPPSEQSMSPLYLSPHLNKSETLILSTVSPTKHLKTPNDSNVHSDIAPKLSRKYLQEYQSSIKHCSNNSGPSSVHLKNSKVRTSLFAEFDVSLAPKQFYPKIDVSMPYSDILSSKQLNPNINGYSRKQNQNRNKRRLLGQINAGVRHNIKKPKDRKSHVQSKLLSSSLARIKTFKKESVVNIELNGFLKNLSDLNASREVRLIQQTPQRTVYESPKSNEISCVKRFQDELDVSVSKKFKHETRDGKVISLPDTSGIEEFVNDDLDIESSQKISKILNLLDESLGENKENKNETKNSNVGYIFTGALLSPTSEMCNMASTMKIDSPKKLKLESFIQKYD